MKSLLDRLIHLGIPKLTAERILPWVQHQDDCDCLIYVEGVGCGACDCGLDAALEDPAPVFSRPDCSYSACPTPDTCKEHGCQNRLS